ncbi:MAG TPA: glucan biosynthesis protein [Acidiferrobacter sp.]|nr:glucan biosynthesis protein [Acidiferrobacter sp.]
MSALRFWRALGVGAGVALILAGCATEGSVRQVRAAAQKARTESGQALAATRAAAAQRQVTDRALQAQLARLESGQRQLLQRVQQLQTRTTHGQATETSVNYRPLTRAAKIKLNTVFAKVAAQAQALAVAPYKAPPAISPELRKLSYTDYGKLKLVGRVPGWPTGTPFHIQLYPAGYLFTWPVRIAIVAGGKTLPAQLPLKVIGDPGLAKRIPGSVPEAGFSAYTPFGHGPSVNQFLSFLGASYFRAVGRGQSWGLSARGIAIDTALPHRAEEFPYFQAFWIVASHPHAHHLTFCALLDSPSLTGAYRFVVRPGRATIVDVKAVLFERKRVRRLGIAPLTSMFLQGRFSHRRFDRLLRSAHDSDGLAIAMPGKMRLWWPLRNPRRIAIYRFPLTNPQGFGLMQRARRAGDYHAFGMHYEDRPDAWVTPEGDWGPGHLVLVELPTNSQTNDNISVFWVPNNQGTRLQPLTFRYRITWQGQNPKGAHLGYVVAGRHAYNANNHSETYVVNFAGRGLARAAVATVTPHVRVFGPAHVVSAWATRKASGNWRLQFEVMRTDSGVVTIHAALMQGLTQVTETWASVLPTAK